jgi:NADH dehydrogenase
MIAVVGGRGAVGSALVARLAHDGHDVVAVMRGPRRDDPPRTRYADLLAPETLRAAVDGAEVVVQVLAVARRRDRSAFSGRGTEHLVAAARAAGARRIVYLSLAGATGRATHPILQACRRAERAVLESGLEAVCLRLALVAGPRAVWLCGVLAAARWLPFLPVPSAPHARQQPVWVGDVADVVSQAVRPRAPQGVFEVGGPEIVSLDELARAVLAAAGIRRRLVRLPAAVVRAFGRAVARVPGTPRMASAIALATEDATARLATLVSAFDVHPTPLATALARSLGRAVPAEAGAGTVSAPPPPAPPTE